MQRMLQFTMPYGCCTDDERAIRDGFTDSCELPSSREQRRGGNGGDGLPERYLIGINHAQNFATEVLHGSCGGSDVERIARRDQNDNKIQSNKSGCSRVILAH